MKRFPVIAAGCVGFIALLALAAPLLPIHDPITMVMAQRMKGPDATHWLGYDEYGRDMLSRLIWGARTSLAVAAAATAIAFLVGTTLGVIAGYVRGVAEMVTMRFADLILCFPPILLALLVVTLAGAGAATLVPTLAILFTPGFARVAHSAVLAVRNQTYVEAMRSLGAGPARIMLRTILPNIAGPLLVQISLTAAAAIILESGLSFLGLGAIPPAPSWGLMIGAARSLVSQAPQLLVWPCLALTITILVINALCDGLRDLFDPLPVATRRRTLAEAILPRQKQESGDVLNIKELDIAIATSGGDVSVVREASLHVGSGETLAVVGESGSGKTLTSLAAMGLLPESGSVTDGTIVLNGRSVARIAERHWQGIRGREISMVFQDHSGSLNPVHRVGRQIAEALTAHRSLSIRQAEAEAVALMRKVGIPDPDRRASAYPHELSGGQRQRIMIAIALANRPSLVVADEPTTALDVTVQAQILDLLATLQRQENVSMIFVSHNLPVVAQVSDRVVVMYAGEIVESGDTKTVFERPRHPYTAGLLNSVPRRDGQLSSGIPGNLPSPAALPQGCTFQPRCLMAIDACGVARPSLEPTGGDRQSRCIRWSEM